MACALGRGICRVQLVDPEDAHRPTMWKSGSHFLLLVEEPLRSASLHGEVWRQEDGRPRSQGSRPGHPRTCQTRQPGSLVEGTGRVTAQEVDAGDSRLQLPPTSVDAGRSGSALTSPSHLLTGSTWACRGWRRREPTPNT